MARMTFSAILALLVVAGAGISAHEALLKKSNAKLWLVARASACFPRSTWLEKNGFY